MAEEHKERTAFSAGQLGFYEFNRLPFGLTSAPATFQRLMGKCIGDMNLEECMIYLDDILVFSETPKASNPKKLVVEKTIMLACPAQL